MADIKNLKIFVGSADGKTEINFVHTDAIDTSKFGPKQAPRVSDVELDELTQEWVARLRDGREIARDPIREVVIQKERVIIDGMLSRGEPIPGFNAPVPATK